MLRAVNYSHGKPVRRFFVTTNLGRMKRKTPRCFYPVGFMKSSKRQASRQRIDDFFQGRPSPDLFRSRLD
jgi:hypothetical protein